MELVDFVRSMVQAVHDDPSRSAPLREPCPDASLVVGLEAEELDELTAKHVTAHLLYCKKCRNAYLTLRSTSGPMERIDSELARAGKAEERQVKESPRIKADTSATRMTQAEWGRFIQKQKDSVIDLEKSYGLKTLVGPCRIVSEPKFASKSVEVGVGNNLYDITVEMNEAADSIQCELSTLCQSTKRPLVVSVRSTIGEKLVTARIDEYGCGHFAFSGRLLRDELFLLTFKLEHAEQNVLFRVPLEKLSVVSKLSSREKAIIELVAQGYAADAIGKKLSLSKQTVKDHLNSIYSRLGISSMAELTRYAADSGPINRKRSE